MERFLKPVSKSVNGEHIADGEAGGVDEQQPVGKWWSRVTNPSLRPI